MGVEGGGIGNVQDVLKDDSGKKVDFSTDEIEEKGEAIEMLIVFMKKTGNGFGPYILDAT